MFRLIRRGNRRMKMRKVKEGDGHRLKDYRLWHIFTRSLFHMEITNDKNEKTKYAINCKYFAEELELIYTAMASMLLLKASSYFSSREWSN